MSWKRALTIAELASWTENDDMDAKATCTAEIYQFSPGHSRNSSNASNTSSPVTSSFSSRSHSRWPSSSSSLVTTPDSPANAAKPALHDLVEEPAEKDELVDHEEPEGSPDEPLCICKPLVFSLTRSKLIIVGDSLFCEHQRPRQSRSAEVMPLSAASRTSDRGTSDDGFSDMTSTERRGSGGSSGDSISTRVSRRWPSISKRLRHRKTTTSASNPSIRSAPPSRSSSARKPSLRQSLATHLGTPAGMPTTTATARQSEGNGSNLSISSWPFSTTSTAFETVQESEQDPIERQELSATPLLPPVLAELRSQEEDGPQSPLQSPSIASPSATESTFSSPVTSPVTQSIRSPPLSAKPSFASIGTGLSKYAAHSSPDVPHLRMSEEIDEWAIKLGHANFHIVPEPYIPMTCDSQSCNRLLGDWKAAQVEYLRQAARISEHYGPTSRTYKLACQKWEEIEAQWQLYFSEAHRKAEASGETLNLEPLQEAQSFTIPDKFPNIDDADIVGPMVQYAKVQQSPPKKSTLLRLFTDPASILRKS